MQVLTTADVWRLELLCDALGDYRRIRSEMDADDFKFVGATSKGGQMVSQWLVACQMCAKRAEAAMQSFGLDPASRARLFVNPQRDLFPDAGNSSRFFGSV